MDDDEVPNLDLPPNARYIERWAEFLSWRLGRYLRRVIGQPAPYLLTSLVHQFERGLQDDNRPLPGDR